MGHGPRRTPAEKAALLAKKIHDQVERAAGKGLNAARIFLTARVRETLSVAAPRQKIQVPGGAFTYVATTPASPHAPPRKLSGQLRRSLTSRMLDSHTAVIGANAKGMPSRKYPQGFAYPAYHELRGLGRRSGQHPFLLPTYRRYRREILRILGGEAKLALKS